MPQLVAMLGFLTHWVMPGIEPTSSGILVKLVTHWATTEALKAYYHSSTASTLSCRNRYDIYILLMLFIHLLICPEWINEWLNGVHIPHSSRCPGVKVLLTRSGNRATGIFFSDKQKLWPDWWPPDRFTDLKNTTFNQNSGGNHARWTFSCVSRKGHR